MYGRVWCDRCREWNRYKHYDAECLQCGQAFCASNGGTPTEFCNKRCRDRAHTQIGRLERENRHLRVQVANFEPPGSKPKRVGA